MIWLALTLILLAAWNWYLHRQIEQLKHDGASANGVAMLEDVTKSWVYQLSRAISEQTHATVDMNNRLNVATRNLQHLVSSQTRLHNELKPIAKMRSAIGMHTQLLGGTYVTELSYMMPEEPA